jgi:glycosyltransferase involved in cell wall biosynthesis
MRVVIVQYAGDYREALQRIKSTGQETYYAQRYSVDSVGALISAGHSVTFITALTKTSYDEFQENGVRAIGAGLSEPLHEAALVALVAEQQPERLIVQTPSRLLMKWAASKPVRTIAVFADSFRGGSLRSRIRNRRCAKLLNRSSFEWVCNHGLNSCASLHAIGVSPDKLIPWDWPAIVTPSQEPKTLRLGPHHVVLFVGMISEEKGVGDTLRAISKLKSDGFDVRLRVVGNGDVDRFTAIADALGVGDRVRFLGLIPHANVIDEMRAADVVAVPSRHAYPEGFPMTIYEALCSRTPLVTSDHPMFEANLRHDVDAWIFPERSADAMAAGIQRLLSDSDLYRRLSESSAEAWSRVQLPVKWGELLSRWLTDSAEDRKWLFDRRLLSGIYHLDRASNSRGKRTANGLLYKAAKGGHHV